MRRCGVAAELVAARGRIAARAALLAGAARRLRQLLPRVAVRRRPHPGRRHPGVQGEPRRRRRLTPGGRRRRRARPDRRGPGLPRRRRGPVPRRRRSRAWRATTCGRARRSRAGSSTCWPRRRAARLSDSSCPGSGRASRRDEARPGRPRADRRSRRPGGVRPAHRPLAGRGAARLPEHDRHISTLRRSFVRWGSGILVRRRGGGCRRRPAPHAIRGAGGPARGAGPSCPTPWSPSPSSPRTTA